VRQRRVGGVLAAVCAAVGASWVLAIGLSAPPSNAGRVRSIHRSASSVVRRADVMVRAAQPQVAVAGPPPETFVARTSGLPMAGEATQSGCSAALEYLNAYAAPGFSFECPGNAQGHQAMTTCVSGASACSGLRLIVIADPCPAAYMNEASNSWDLVGASDAPLDPYGYCG
jgi:hypothetical protein